MEEPGEAATKCKGTEARSQYVQCSSTRLSVAATDCPPTEVAVMGCCWHLCCVLRQQGSGQQGGRRHQGRHAAGNRRRHGGHLNGGRRLHCALLLLLSAAQQLSRGQHTVNNVDGCASEGGLRYRGWRRQLGHSSGRRAGCRRSKKTQPHCIPTLSAAAQPCRCLCCQAAHVACQPCCCAPELLICRSLDTVARTPCSSVTRTRPSRLRTSICAKKGARAHAGVCGRIQCTAASS